MKTKIIVCCHKKDFWIEDDIYMPIHLGKANGNIGLGIQGDNTGDNISTKNPNYCELTGLYWAWKNLKDVDYVGLCHYRRYFDFSASHKIIDGEEITPNELKRRYAQGDLTPDLDKIFTKYDAVVSPRLVLSYSPGMHYTMMHVPEELRLMKEAIHQVCPQYDSTFVKCMEKRNWHHPYNMILCKKKLFDNYASWFFSVIDEVSQHAKISEYPYQSRIFGFMGEMLLQVYFEHNRLRMCPTPILVVLDSPKKQSKTIEFLKKTIGRVRKWIIFVLINKTYPR